MPSGLTRRTFMKTGAAVGVAAAAARGSVMGANDRIGLGFIGVANRGGQLLSAAMKNDDMDVVALCDVDESALNKAAERVEPTPALYGDWRKMMERDDIDGVVIATPDHWHALLTIAACDAGKDVYVEKPLSITIVEGRRMVEAARRNNRVVQVGTHRRSSALVPQLREMIRQGTVGKVTVASCYRISNMSPDGIGHDPGGDPPPGMDWDMWLGPRPYRPFSSTIHPYRFRWHKLYSSQVGNWGVHYFDLIRWLLDEQAPTSVCALGGTYAVDDDRSIPDTMEAIFELPSGCLVIFGQYEASHTKAISGDAELRGTLGCISAGGSSFEIAPERGGQFQSSDPRMEPMTLRGDDGDLTDAHMRNFLDCIKSREKPNADVEDGHRSTTFAHLANIALETRSRIEWDPEKERITNNKAANKLLHYEYRAPWKLT
jgi:predicted dehydrogenase